MHGTGSLAAMSDALARMLEAGLDPRADIFNRLLKNRVVMLGTDVNDDIANQICAQLLYLEGEDDEQGHLAVHQQPGRLGHGRHGDLRHDAVRRLRRRHGLPGPGRLDGPVPALRRRRRQALHAAQRPDHDAPAARRPPGPGRRHRHPGRAARLHQAAHGRAHRPPHRPDRSSRSRPTPSATAGSPPSRPRSTACATRSRPAAARSPTSLT